MKGERFSQCIFGDLKTTFHHSRTDYNGVIDEYEMNEMWRVKAEHATCELESIKN